MSQLLMRLMSFTADDSPYMTTHHISRVMVLHACQHVPDQHHLRFSPFCLTLPNHLMYAYMQFFLHQQIVAATYYIHINTHPCMQRFLYI